MRRMRATFGKRRIIGAAAAVALATGLLLAFSPEIVGAANNKLPANTPFQGNVEPNPITVNCPKNATVGTTSDNVRAKIMDVDKKNKDPNVTNGNTGANPSTIDVTHQGSTAHVTLDKFNQPGQFPKNDTYPCNVNKVVFTFQPRNSSGGATGSPSFVTVLINVKKASG